MTDDAFSGQRALWTLLIATLVAPFIAAVIILASSLVAGLIGRGPASLLGLPWPGKIEWAALKAVETFVWAAIPAAIAGVVAAVIVQATGKLHWLAAATLSAVSASVLATLSGGMLAQHVTPIAFIAAVTGILTRQILARGGVIS